MKALGLYFLLMPSACAMLSGVVVWASNRRHTLDDNSLIRQFLLLLSIGLVIGWGLSQTPTARLRFDPQYRLQTELDAHPVYAVIRRTAPDDHKKLVTFLAAQLSQGRTLGDAFVAARTLLMEMARDRLGWADHKTTVSWAQVTIETLRELQAQDPKLCYRTRSARVPGQPALDAAFSAANTAAFQEAIVELYESAHRGINHQHPAGDKPVEFNDAAREFRVIHDAIGQRFGEPMGKLLAKKVFTDPAPEPPQQVCAAMIYQLEAMQSRPPAMAARLIDSILR